MFCRVMGCVCLLMCGVLHAAQVAATNDHVLTVINVNGATPVQDATMMEHIAKLDAGFCELRASVDGRLKAIESRAVREDAKEEKIAERLDKAQDEAESFYGKRYGELRIAHDRFMDRISVILVLLSIFVAVIGVLATVFGIVVPLKKEHLRDKEWVSLKGGLKDDVDRLKSDAFHAFEKDRSLKAEFYFQMAKLGFENYKATKSEEILEIVVKNLSQCIMHNVGTFNAAGARSAIAFLNCVMLRNNANDLPFEIVEHRKSVALHLKRWEWGFGLDELELLFDKSDIDDQYVHACIDTMKRVFALVGVEKDCDC